MAARAAQLPLSTNYGDRTPSPQLRQREAASFPPEIAAWLLLRTQMHQSDIPEGIDEKNACRLLIDVCSFSTLEDGRSVYCKGRLLQWWVDSEEYSIIDMEKDVSKHYRWASSQEPNFWFVSHSGQTVRLGTDQELLTPLRASKQVKFIMTVDRCEHAIVCNVTEMDNQSQVSDEENDPPIEGTNADNSLLVTNEVNELQIRVASEVNEVQIQNMNRMNDGPGQVAVEFDGQEWAEEPELGVTAAGPARLQEEEVEYYMEPGVDPDGDEPTGVDEEWRYFKKQQRVGEGDNNETRQQQTKKVEKKGDKKGKDFEAFDPDMVVPSDEATMISDDYIAHTTYDRDNPEIKVGSTFQENLAPML